MYKYYKECFDEEHLLFSWEIKSLYNLPLSISTTNLNSLLLEISKERGYDVLYYPTRFGMKEVYPEYVYKDIKKILDKECKIIYGK